MTDRGRALLALALLAPIPSLGVIAAMVVAPGPSGHAVFLAGKLWLIAFPAIWHLTLDKGRPSWSPPRRGGLMAGAASGAVLAAAIVGGVAILGIDTVDPRPLRTAAGEMGLATPSAFLAAAAVWTVANSLIEEYVWRWFVLTRCEVLAGGAAAAALSAALFTAHHAIAVSRYLEPGLAVLASGGIFVGGVVWAGLYLRYRSIWPGWISHALADAAVFAVGWRLLFN